MFYDFDRRTIRRGGVGVERWAALRLGGCAVSIGGMAAIAMRPMLEGAHGPISAEECRLAPDGEWVAFYANDCVRRGVYLALVQAGESTPEDAELVCEVAGEISSLSWSRDGKAIVFMVGGVAGEIWVWHLSDERLRKFPGAGYAVLEGELMVADVTRQGVYRYDFETEDEERLFAFSHDAREGIAPTLAVGPDGLKVALTAQSVEPAMVTVWLAHAREGAWAVELLTSLPGSGQRITPFWSADGLALALHVVDMEQHHTSIVAVPNTEGAGEILYTSDSIDPLISPVSHPEGRLIAMVRSHPRDDTPTLSAPRVVLLDPVEHAVAPLTTDGEIVGRLSWVDAQTLLVEGRGVWTLGLRVSDPEKAAPEGFSRTLISDPELGYAFAVELPQGWRRVTLPDDEIDFSDPRVMRPICLYTAGYAAIVFTVAVRPVIEEMPLGHAMAMLAQAQGLEIDSPRELLMPFGSAVECMARQMVRGDPMRLRIVLTQRGGQWLSFTTMAPAALWEALTPMLEHIIQSVAFP